jgi:hypothetical protein
MSTAASATSSVVTDSTNKTAATAVDTAPGAAPATAPATTAAGTSSAPPPAVNVAVDPGPEPPPALAVPTVSTDWKAAPRGRGKGARARQAQVSNAAAAAKEIAGSATYAADFGPHAPSQARVAHFLAGASGWRSQWVGAKRWVAYSAEQNAVWWDAALAIASLFQPAFEYAIARDPTIAEKYPAMLQFIESGTVIAKRAASVRKARKPAVKKPTKKALAQAAKEAAAAAAAAQHPAGTPTPGGTTTK